MASQYALLRAERKEREGRGERREEAQGDKEWDWEGGRERNGD